MYPIFSTSSRSSRKINPDGTRNVMCIYCGEFICKTLSGIGTATCEICRRVLNGEPMNEEMIRTYRLAKRDHVDVSMVTVQEETPKEFKKFSLTNLGGGIRRALGMPPAKTQESKAAKIARQQRRGGLFDNIKLNESLGSMDQIDENLQDEKK